jgi:hypothetical protein
VELRRGEAYVEASGTTDFMLSHSNPKKRNGQKKVYFKAADPRERDLWVQRVMDAISDAPIAEPRSVPPPKNVKKSKKQQLIEPFREDLYATVQSKLFVDECDFENKMQAFHEVERMFTAEISALAGDPQLIDPGLIARVSAVKNLSRTMSGLIKNVVAEVEQSRNQMFRLLEDVATIEILSKEEER